MADKVVNDLNQIWVEREGEAVKIGFTRDFLEQLDQCWHILPANNRKFKRKMPLMTVETNDGLVSILSPVDGFLFTFDQKAQNFPDRLTEDDVVLHITAEEAKKEKKAGDMDFNAALRQLRAQQAEERAAAVAGMAPRWGRPFGGVINIPAPPLPMEWAAAVDNNDEGI